MSEKQNKKNKKTIILLVVLILVIVGTTFALYTNTFSGTKDVVIDTNNLKFNYNETSNSITLNNPDGLSDTEGLTNGGTFTFDVSASSTKEQTVYYTIYLTEETTNTMDSSYVKLALLDNSNNILVRTTSYKNLSDSTKKANAKILYMNEINLPTQNNIKQNYTLKYWVSSEIDTITKTTNNKKQTATLSGGEFKFKVNVMRTAESGAKALIKKAGTDGIVAESHPATEQLVATTDYRYTGANPNNYITFNNEKWRIIGVFDVDNGTGNLEKRIKIIRNESIGNVAWDSNVVNNWLKSSGMHLLNAGDYWNRTGSYASNGLTDDAKSLIADTKWYLGGIANYTNASDGLASHFYGYERGKTVYNSTSPIAWVGKVGLMYPSDYGYATSGGTTTNRAACLAKEMNNWGSSSFSDCKNNDWLYNSSLSQWTLSPNSGYSGGSLYMNSAGYVGIDNVNSNRAFRPSIYLSSDIQIAGGNGSSDTPYKIS